MACGAAPPVLLYILLTLRQDELKAELEALEQEELDDRLAGAERAPVHAPLSPVGVGRERECELEYLVVETRLIRGFRGHRPSRGGRRGGSAPPASSRARHVRDTERRDLKVYLYTSVLSVTRLGSLTRPSSCRYRRSARRVIASSPARPILGPARHVTSVVPSRDPGHTLSARQARPIPSLGSIVSACTITDAVI